MYITFLGRRINIMTESDSIQHILGSSYLHVLGLDAQCLNGDNGWVCSRAGFAWITFSKRRIVMRFHYDPYLEADLFEKIIINNEYYLFHDEDRTSVDPYYYLVHFEFPDGYKKDAHDYFKKHMEERRRMKKKKKKEKKKGKMEEKRKKREEKENKN